MSINGKFKTIGILVCLLLVSAFSPVSASGWGKTGNEYTYNGNQWDEVYLERSDLHFTAEIPQFSHVQLEDENAYIIGYNEQEDEYFISTRLNLMFKTPKTLEDFRLIVEKTNPDFAVTAQSAEGTGALYVVDLFPKDPWKSNACYYRFLLANGRIVQMCTQDKDTANRDYFFRSIHIHELKLPV